jgi:hypothetical protein
MGYVAKALAIVAALILALPQGWCCILPGAPRACCQCCDQGGTCKSDCCNSAAKPNRGPPQKKSPCACGKDLIKQAHKVGFAVSPTPVLLVVAGEPPVVERLFMQAMKESNLQQLLCRWRC